MTKSSNIAEPVYIEKRFKAFGVQFYVFTHLKIFISGDTIKNRLYEKPLDTFDDGCHGSNRYCDSLSW